VRELAAKRDVPDATLPMPRAIVLSPGRPERAIRVFRLTHARGFPRGVYASHDDFGLWIVVISELPETPDTLCLRVLGRGKVLQRAVAELAMLSRNAWERRLLAILVQWRREVVIEGIQSEDDEDFMQTTQFSLEAFEQQLRDEGVSQGISQGSARVTARLIERRIGRTLTSAEHQHLSDAITAEGAERVADLVLDLSPDALAHWVTRGT
jgi:hypothetical protein